MQKMPFQRDFAVFIFVFGQSTLPYTFITAYTFIREQST